MAKRQVFSVQEISGEVGRLFGTTEAHARRWLDQRNELISALSTLRDKATALISELSGNADRSARTLPDHKASERSSVVQKGMRESRKKRVVSAQTRAKMRAAAKRRWAQLQKRAASTR